jgi:hypothetical protein
MELDKNEYAILVACHQDSNVPGLSSPFLEVCVQRGESKPAGYEHYVSRENGMLIYPEAWSEIEVFLDLKSFTDQSKIVGLQHYRRIFSLEEGYSEAVIPMQVSQRNQFAAAQVQHLVKYRNEIIIPRKWEFSYSAWDQFLDCKPELEAIFTFGLNQLDLLLRPYFGVVNSKAILQESFFLYPLNMFIGKVEFFSEWREILSDLVGRIEREAPAFEDTLTPRWGGFLAERYFSIYINLCRESNRWVFVEKSVVIFDFQDEKNQPEDLIQRCEVMVNPTPWKFTKPLRVFINIFRK